MAIENKNASALRTFRRLRSRWAESKDPDRFLVGSELSGTFLGCGPEGTPALLIPISRRVSIIGQVTHGLALRAFPDLSYEFEDRNWRAPTAVLECTDPSLDDTFAVLVVAIAEQLEAQGTIRTWQDVSRVVRSWQSLFRSKRSLGAEEETGLWGELWFLLQSEDPDALMESWRGPHGDPWDFVNGEYALECKTTTTRLHHHVSLRQVDGSASNRRTVFFSLHVDSDATQGKTLKALVASVRERLSRTEEFDRKLALVKYSDDEADGPSRAFTVREAPLVFDHESVPRVLQFDPGVSAIRYEVDLSEDRALDSKESVAVLDSFWQRGRSPSEGRTTT